MRMPHVADRFFHRHKRDPNDPAPLFDTGIGDWMLESYKRQLSDLMHVSVALEA